MKWKGELIKIRKILKKQQNKNMEDHESSSRAMDNP